MAAFAWALCLMGANVMISIVLTGAGRAKADFTLDDLKAPRAMFDRLPPFGQRAVWAQENSWEALTLGAPAMLLCLVAGVDSSIAATAAWAWAAMRFIISLPTSATFLLCVDCAGPPESQRSASVMWKDLKL